MAYKITKIQGRWRKHKTRYAITRGKAFLGVHFWKWSVYFPFNNSFGEGFDYNNFYDKVYRGVFKRT